MLLEDELVRLCPVTMGHGALRGGLDCPAGWTQIVRKLACAVEEYAVKNHKDLKVVQVKSKFGGLRYYMSAYDEAIEALIREAEIESLRTCMVCGQQGKPRGSGYVTTVCDEHTG